MICTVSRWFILTACMAFGLIATAQPGTLQGHFINYNASNGLSSRNINCLTQDSRGVMWIGTEEGLNRFDGVNFRWYLSDDGPGAIPENEVNHILPAENGKLWVALAGRGVALYLPESDTFEQISWTSPDSTRPATSVRFIHEHSADELWLACGNTALHEGGLVKLDPHTKQATFFPDTLKISPRHIVTDPNDPDLLWLAGSKFGWYNMRTNTYGLVNYKGEGSRRINSYQWITPDGNGDYWVSTWGRGVIRFDPQTREWGEPCFYDTNEVYTSQRNAARKMVRKTDSTYWVMTADAGFGVFNEASRSFAFYKNNPADPYSIWSISARDVYPDDQGIVWVGMASGLSIMNPYVQQISYQPLEIGSNQNEQHFKFNHAALAGEHLLVSGSYANGYYLLDPATKRLIRKVGTGEELGIRTGLSGVELLVGADGHFYSMIRNDLWRIDAETLHGEEILDLGKVRNRSGFKANINTIWQAKDGSMWLGTDDNALHQYWPSTGELRDFWLESESSTPVYNLIFELAEDDDGNIWAAANYGIYRVSPNGQITHLRDLSPEYAALPPAEVLSLVCTGDQVVVGTSRNGLMIYDLETGELIQKGRKDGMMSLTVGEMAVDHSHNVWGVTANGVFRYISNTGRIEWYSQTEGLKYVGMVHNEVSVLSNGEVILGFDHGIGYFHPDSLLEQPLPLGMIFTGASVDGSPIVSVRSLDHGATIELKPNEERTEIRFQALGYVHPEQYQYRFRLWDEEEEWTHSSAGMATFSNLDAGEYQLQVQVGNKAGEWLDRTFTLSIKKRVAFWNTTWFLILVAALLILALFFFIRWRVQSERQKAELKRAYDKRISELEMMAFRAQMNPHFLFNCLNSIKYFIIRKQTDQASDYLTKFGRLIRLILQNSALEVIPLSSEIEALKLYVELEMVRLDDRFHFEIEVDDALETDFIEIPPLVIQPFVENAIWHGLLNREEPGGQLKVSISRNEEKLHCLIEDNGIGRKKAAEIGTTSARSKRSMGLEITRKRLERMQNISASNVIHITDLTDEHGNAKGTRVELEIPI